MPDRLFRGAVPASASIAPGAMAAEAVKRDAADGLVIAGVECRHAAHVATLLALLRAGAPDLVIDIARVETVALVNRLQHGRGQMLWLHVRERAVADFAAAARCEHCVNDGCFCHLRYPRIGD